ncbi:MAG: TrpB-like pyridoxal phosphate-dependent enzyme [Candidatus Saganbacteria bacterium]|nr:TrpB-like pyridoxal phosphate-dependent enzyme [Candidatus Saganbacteria bacterium]
MDKERVLLPISDIPKAWYNVLSDLPGELPPPINPATGKPLGPDDLAPIFPMALIMQEMSQEKWIEIPSEVLEILKIWRPTPLKGVKRLCTETGAGQWGSALAFACNLFGLKCTVYMVKVSYHQKPYRKSLMGVWGAEVYASPTNLTNSGKAILAKDPASPGSLGIAISEAVEDAATHDDAKYSLGSVLNHVLLHQTVVGLETKKQLELIGEKPDTLIGCVGGGSNFAGFCIPFVPDKLNGKNIKMIAVEPTACPTFTKGVYTYDFGDTAKLTPLVKMYTLGHGFIPPGIHAGGLRYHGAAPILSLLVKKGIVEARGYTQNPVFEAGLLFARTEGLLPAPETSHAIKCAIDEARKNEDKCIVFNYSGHGYFDLSAYDQYLEGKLEDFEYPEAKVKEALKDLPKF